MCAFWPNSGAFQSKTISHTSANKISGNSDELSKNWNSGGHIFSFWLESESRSKIQLTYIRFIRDKHSGVKEFFTKMDATIFVASSIIVILVYVWKFRENKGKLPPGPWGLPILGYLPFIDSNSPQLTVDKLIKTYGQTVYVNFGQVPCVILSDPKIIKNCFSNCKYK